MRNFFNLCPTISEMSQKSIKLWWDISVIFCIIILLLLSAITCAQYIQIIRLKKTCVAMQYDSADLQKEEKKLQGLITRRDAYIAYNNTLSGLALKATQLHESLVGLVVLMPARLKWTSYEYIQDKHIVISGKADSPGLLALFMKNMSESPEYKNHELTMIKTASRNTQKCIFNLVVTPMSA